MAVPAYFTVYHAGRLLGGSPDSDLFNILTVYLTRALTVYLIAAIGAVVFFRLVFLLSNDLAASIITTIGCALGTLMLPYGMVFYGHVVGAVFCLTAFYLVFTLRHGCGKPRPWLRAGGAGLLLGLSVISEYPTIILAVLIGIYALPVLRRSAWAALLCGALPLVGLMLYNQTCFGSPLATGYDGYLNAPAGFFSKMRMGLYGLSMPSLGVLYSLTFSQIGRAHV